MTVRGPASQPLPASVSTAEQSNTSIIFGERLIMKLFRRLEPGLNPDLEIGRFLTERSSFANIPPLAGAIEYRSAGVPMSLALLQGFVPNHGDAWYYTLGVIAQSFKRLLAAPGDYGEPGAGATAPLGLADSDLPPAARALLGDYLA